MLALIRQKHDHSHWPVDVCQSSINKGIDEFYAQCEKVGVDSVLVADVPLKSRASRQAALRHNVAPIFICPPNADDDLLRR
ncbi:tryptophan synthase subunit alpha [Escherichia coli]